METRTQSSISSQKEPDSLPTPTSCQFDQLYLSQSFGVTTSEAGKKIRWHSFVLTSGSSAMSGDSTVEMFKGQAGGSAGAICSCEPL